MAVCLDAKQGLNLAGKIAPDLILLDIMMPRIDGLGVLSRLKKNDKTSNIPVIILSSKDDDEAKMQASELYNEDYITKPFEPQTLIDKVISVLERQG